MASKKLGIIAIIGALAFAAYKYIGSAKKLLNLKAAFNGLKVHKIDLSNLTLVLRVNLAIVNPNSENLTATAVTGNLTKDGTLVATFNWDGERVLTGNNAVTTINDIEIKLMLNTNTILAVYKNGGLKNFGDFLLTGRITADGNTYPVTTTITL